MSENLSVEKTALLLGRGTEEVGAKINRYCQATLEGWNARRRLGRSTDTPAERVGIECRGSTAGLGGMLRLAQTIYRTEFTKLMLEPGDVERQVWKAAEHTLRYFRPEAGDQDVRVGRRFVGLFRYRFKQPLYKELRRKRWRNCGRPKVRLYGCIPEDFSAVEEADLADDPHEGWLFWARQLFQLALGRLDGRTRKVFEMRMGGVSVKEIACRLGIAEKTISNQYGLGRTAQLVRGKVRELVLALADEDLRAVVRYMRFEAGLTGRQIAGLLSLTVAEIGDLLGEPGKTDEPALGREDVVRLLSGRKGKRTDFSSPCGIRVCDECHEKCREVA